MHSVLQTQEASFPLKVMTFNIWLGGKLEGRHEHGWKKRT